MIDFKKFPLAAKRDRVDARDRMKAVGPVAVPERSVVGYLPPIMNQGQESSCTGHAVAYFWESLLATTLGKSIALSPRFLWWAGRAIEGAQLEDVGVEMRDAIAALKQYGACPAEHYPASGPVDAEPSQLAFAYGTALCLPAYERCADLNAIKYAIGVERFPVVIGLQITEDWYTTYAVKTGLIGFYPSSAPIGGHALCIVGYDDTTKRLRLANSWGTTYGFGGFVEVDYTYLTDGQPWDAWTAAPGCLAQPGNAEGLPAVAG